MGTTALIALAVAAALLAKLDAYHLLLLVSKLRVRLGTLRALVFAVVLRCNFMNAHPECAASLENAAWHDGDGYAFNPPGATTGLLFVPGGLVQPEAYAPVLRQLAEESGRCCICIRPPFRHPMLLDKRRAQQICEQRAPAVRAWTIGGHSLGSGSFGAARLVEQWLHKPGSPCINGLLLWAGTLTSTDLSRDCTLPCLALLASEDPIVPPEGTGEGGLRVRESIRKYCPPHTRTIVIRGGNHAGFGSYGPQTFPFADGKPTMLAAEQRRRVVEHTAAFLRSTKEYCHC